MSSSKRSAEVADKARQAASALKPAADQMKPLARSAGKAAQRQLRRTRAWAAPQVERTGQVLQDSVAPKVSAALSSAADRIDPGKAPTSRWRVPAILAGIAAALSGAAAFIRSRSQRSNAQPDAGPASGQPLNGHNAEHGTAEQATTDQSDRADTSS
jgi:hypothetical protein